MAKDTLHNRLKMLREDIDLSGSCTIVLYHDEAFFVRLLRRGKPRTFLTRAAEIPTGELERLKNVMDMCREARVSPGPVDFVFGDNVLRVDRDKIVAGVLGEDSAEGFADSLKLTGAIVRMFLEIQRRVV